MHFIEISIVFSVAFLLGYIINLLKQPPLIGYIISGAILGPLFLNRITDIAVFESFSHIGIAFLLYIVGLHLSYKEIKDLGTRPMLIGIFQVLFTAIVSFVILINFFDILECIILSVAISLSSTIIIVKLISDKEDSDELYGKILFSILIVQDIVATIFLIVLNSLSYETTNNAYLVLIIILFLKAIGLIIALKIFVVLALDKIIDSIAKSQELMFLFSVAWCFTVAALFQYVGLSLEIGALIAGVLLASSTYQAEISAKVRPLRDFFIILFFLLLGLKIGKVTLGEIVIIEIILVLTLIVKPTITYLIIKIFKYPKEVRFLSAISMGQISEFSLIIVMLAATQFQNSRLVSIVTISTIISIVISSYLIKYNENIFKFLIKKGLIKYNNVYTKEEKNSRQIVIFGYDRIGFSLFRMIKNLNKDYLILDYNPSIIKKLKNYGIKCMYGDANDQELLNDINFLKTKLIISTIPNLDTSKLILKHIRKKNKTATIILTAHKIEHSLELYQEGADYVILPHFLGGEYISSLIEHNYNNLGELLKEKVKHINELERRKKEGLEHPEHKKE